MKTDYSMLSVHLYFYRDVYGTSFHELEFV